MNHSFYYTLHNSWIYQISLTAPSWQPKSFQGHLCRKAHGIKRTKPLGSTTGRKLAKRWGCGLPTLLTSTISWHQQHLMLPSYRTVGTWGGCLEWQGQGLQIQDVGHQVGAFWATSSLLQSLKKAASGINILCLRKILASKHSFTSSFSYLSWHFWDALGRVP